MSLPLWVEFFDDLVNVRGRSQNTVLAYRRDLELYSEFIKTSTDISKLYVFMKKHGLSDRSQARVISSLRTYYRFCEDRGKKAPELRDLKVPKVKANLPEVLSFEHFKKLYDSCPQEDVYKSARNQITLLLLFGLGCRVSELIGLDLHDYSETQNWLSIVGKGEKQRLVPLTEHLAQELKTYLTSVRPNLVKAATSSILINDHGHRPSRVDIWRWLQAWSQKAGFETVIYPHQFRHGCATALLEAGADLRSIQMLLGHSSIQTTQIYTSVTTNKLTQTIDEFHPLSKLK